jgi:hypothetical protein
MKVGDLVRLSIQKTRRGMPYEDKIGLVIKILTQEQQGLITVNFGGVMYTFKRADLEVTSECR